MDELIHSLRPISQTRLFKKGAHVIFQGEIPRKAFLVREGIVRAYVIKPSGEESIISFFTKDDLIPAPWLFGATSNSLFYYDAVSDVRVMAFAKEDFHKIMASNVAYLNVMVNYLSKQYTSFLVRITGLEQSRAIEKISFTFYYLLFHYGVEKSPGIYEINVALNHLMLANLTGLTRESTTTNLKSLKDKGIISYTRAIYTVNKRKLEGFIGEDGFRELKF